MSADRRETTSGDPLDDLLASARWPEPSGASTRRLEQAWVELHRPGPRWRTGPVALSAIAAAVVVAVGAWALLMMPRQTGRTTISHVSPTPAGTASVSNLARPSLWPGREPTALELTMLAVAERRGRQSIDASPRSAPPPAAARDPSPAEVEARLARQIARADGRVTAEVAARFCAVATDRSLPLVLKLAQRPNTRPTVTDALARLADARTLSRFVREAQSAGDRKRLIGGMLSRMSSADVPDYLELVGDCSTRGDALAALDRALDRGAAAHEVRLAELFFARLDDPRADLRESAALALGRIDSSDVTNRLIERVATDQGRREAFLALASSRRDAAQEFMRQAATSDRFAGPAQSALAQVEVGRQSDDQQQQYSIESRS
jgi:hypothetical protein